MALALEDRPIRPLTADEVMRMVEAGILPERGYELLHGVLTEVSQESPEHVAVSLRIQRWLAPAFAADRYLVRPAFPIVVPDRTSLPVPDIAVVEPGIDPKRHPETAHLVVEVALTSLRIDLRVKPPLYAAAGVQEMWVVDVAKRRVEVFTDPTASGYVQCRTVDPPGRLQPVALDVEPLDLAELFAGL